MHKEMLKTHEQCAERILPLDQPAPMPVGIDPEALIARAIDAGLPVESLERLLAMRNDLKQEQAREAFAAALSAFQARIPAIRKRQTANAGKYRYRYAALEDIWRAISDELSAHGLSVTFDTRQDGDTLFVGAVVHHVDGHSERTEFPVPIDRQARMNDTQKIGSALTYGRRYALTAALGIVTADEDDDAQSSQPEPEAHAGTSNRPAPPVRQNGAPISEAQHRRLEARINELGLDRERVKAWIKRAWAIEHLNEIPRDRYDRLDRRLEAWAAVAAEEEARAERAAIQAENQA